MAFAPLNNGIRVTLEWVQDNQVVITVWYLQLPVVVTSFWLDTVAVIFRDWWINTFRQNFSNEIALQMVVARDVSTEFGGVSQLPVSPVSPGGILQAAMTNQAAIVVTLLTALTGRSFRGRHYFAGLARGDVLTNYFEAVVLQNILDDHVTLAASLLSGAGAKIVVASYVSNGAPRISALGTEVTDFAADTRVDTQRRRLPPEV